jgi:hypothetical protein
MEELIERCDKFAIIGAGPVGLGMARALLKHEIPYDELEADSDLGGNWKHGVYTTAHIISSRKTTEFADYPMPADYPDFPSAQQMYDYLCDYARHFKLLPHIKFNTKVLMARPLPDRRWELELDSGERRIYKGVLVCNGHHWDRRWPNYPGKFTGEYIHSKDYRSPDMLRGKRVLVIGGGNSACDIAAESARVAQRCDLSIRRGYWFLPKTMLGIPTAELALDWAPVWLQRAVLRLLLRVIVGDYRKYGLPLPNHRIFEAHPTLNSELLHYIKHGRIKPRPDIARFKGQRVHFVDGTSEGYDLVIAATGFHVSFPFLPPGLVPVKGPIAQVYGGCVLPDCKHLYIIGSTQVRYGFGPLVTPGAEVVVQMMQLQDQMELPIGLVMKESGVRLPTTHLVDPFKTLRSMRRAKHTLPLLLRKERSLRAKYAAGMKTGSEPSIAPMRADTAPQQINSNLQVY